MNYKIILAAFSIIVAFSYYYYDNLLKTIPKKIAKSNDTITSIDKLRFTYKMGNLCKRGLSEYLLALNNKDQDAIEKALDYYEAAIGFGHIKHTKDDKLEKYVLPKIESSIDIISKNKLNINKTKLDELIEINKQITNFIQNNEQNTWTNIQEDYVEFRIDEYKTQFLFKVLFFMTLLFLALVTFSLLNRSFLQKTNKALNNKLSYAADHVLAGYWEVDLSTKQMKFSDGWLEFLGYEKEDIKHDLKSMMKLIHPDDMDSIKETIQSYLNNQESKYDVQYRILNKQKEYIWVNAIGLSDGKKFYGFHIDVNDLVNAQEQLFTQSKMASMGDMIGNIAHQWRQPLSVISTAASGLLLKKEYGMLDDEYFAKTLNEIENSAQYLSKTIDTFRNFIKEKKEFKEVILQERVQGALEIVETTLSNNHIDLFNNIDQTEPIKLKLVTGELSQVVINIINNAKDAIKEKKIDEPWVKLELKKEENTAVLTIEDNGGGIPKEVMPKIFDPYFTTKGESQGTGLGLHMSYKIITESLHGKIYAKNTSIGVKFFIELPLE